MYILIPVAAFGTIGLVMGLVLAAASKVFSVEKDERIDKVLEKLPGANCGGCGYAGCSACAEAIVKGEAEINACPGNSQENVSLIAKIMGVREKTTEPKAAFVKCCGEYKNVNYGYFFDGTKSCNDVFKMRGGDKECVYSCLGYGDCLNACKFGAISLKDGIAAVDREKCVGCGMCRDVCPKQVIDILPKKAKVYVKCSSKEKGVLVKNKCSVGCIGCGLCSKNCPLDAINVIDNLAVIDYDKCRGCGLCAEKCPKKIIIKV